LFLELADDLSGALGRTYLGLLGLANLSPDPSDFLVESTTDLGDDFDLKGFGRHVKIEADVVADHRLGVGQAAGLRHTDAVDV